MPTKNRKQLMPYLTGLMLKLAPRAGAKVIVEPEWKIVGQIIYSNGVVRSFRHLSLDLNSIASSDIAKDKDYAKFFMERRGYPVARGETFFQNWWARKLKSKRNIFYAHTYAKKLGYPVIVKPNSSSQGANVCLVWNKKELTKALREVWKGDRTVIIEQYLPGRDYRVLALRNEIISAYERIPLSVTGDGKSSIVSLLNKKNKYFIASGRDTRINFQDVRIKLKLKKQNLSLKSILPKNQIVYLLDNANLSTGGEAKDVTNTIHSSFKKIAINVTREMGLRIAGVDIMVTHGDITKKIEKNNYYIIEINSAPGLDHYVTTGKKQKAIVEAMYLKILKALGKKD